MKEFYASDLVEPILKYLNKSGKKEIEFNKFVDGLNNCRDEFPKLFKNTKRNDIIKEIDNLKFLDKIKFHKKENGLFLSYLMPKLEIHIHVQTLPDNIIKSLANNIYSKDNQASL